MVFQDIRFAVRLLIKQPRFSLIAILTMALGIGVSAALFSVIDAALLRPVPFANASELVTVSVRETFDREPISYAPSMQDVRTWRELNAVFSHIGSGRVSGFSDLIVDAGEPERLTVGSASEDFIEAYGAAPIMGRGFSIDDTREGAEAVVLLGHAYWRARFAADPAVVGRSLRIDDAPATIIGVLPAGFYDKTAVWQAQRQPASWFPMRGSGTPVVARLKRGVTPAQAALQADAVLEKKPRAKATQSVLQSLYDSETAGSWSTLQTLSGAVALLLVIACVNLAGLLVARGFTRQPELAIRASLGASRTALVRQMLTESMVLALAGSVVGLTLAWATLDSVVALIPLRLPANSPVRINLAVLASTLVVTIATASLCGLAPALWLSRRRSLAAVAQTNRAAGAALSGRLGQALVAGEVALALMLLAGSGLLVKSFVKLISVDLGYDPASFLTLEVEPVERATTLRNNYYAELTKSLAAMPEVAAAGAIDRLSLLGGRSFMSTASDTGAPVRGPYRTVLPGFFETLAVRPIAGRLFTDADRIAGDAAIVNEEMARAFPDGAVGHTLVTKGSSPRTMRIVGVVPGLRLGGPIRTSGPEMYVLPDPRSSDPPRALAIVIRPRGGASIPRERLASIAGSIGPRIVVDEVRSGSAILDEQVARPKHLTILIVLLGGFGLFLTLVGIFGVTAYAVARRTREIGVRLALGASPRRVVRAVARGIVVPIAIGLVAGLTGAQAATKLVASFLFETTPHDPATFTVIAALVAIAAVLAAWIPARRAAAVDPIVALRTE